MTLEDALKKDEIRLKKERRTDYYRKDGMIMKTLNNMLSEQLEDEEFRKEYEAVQPEMNVIRAIVDASTSQNLIQKELAERTGINQADS